MNTGQNSANTIMWLYAKALTIPVNLAATKDKLRFNLAAQYWAFQNTYGVKMKFAAHSKGRVSASDKDINQVRLVLSRIETCFPHLIFDPWHAAVLETVQGSIGNVLWKPSHRVEISVTLENGLKLSTLCRRTNGKIDQDDYDFLLRLANEAAEMLGSKSGLPIPLIEFGSHAVAERIRSLASIDGDVYATIMFMRSLVHETYENQRLSYGLILSNRTDGTFPLSESFDNKRLKRITDGFSTAIVLDQWQRIADFVHLDVPERESLLLTRRPWWCSALATKSKFFGGVGIALIRSGDLVVINRGQLLFSQRAGRWQIWNHRAILATLRESWFAKGRRGNVNNVLGCLYHVALDLSFKRSGGLLVVLHSRKNLNSLLMSRADGLGAVRRGSGEQALDQILMQKSVQYVDRRILADIASLDGALIVDRFGKILAYGAMTKPAASTYQGARAKAAVAASRKGVVIKISSDGNISFFAEGKNFMDI